MKPKTRFTKVYYKLPEKARRRWQIVYDNKPYSANVVFFEVRSDTELGREFLKSLRYEE